MIQARTLLTTFALPRTLNLSVFGHGLFNTQHYSVRSTTMESLKHERSMKVNHAQLALSIICASMNLIQMAR